MKLTTSTITTLAVLCLGIVLPASDAVGQKKTLKELVVGTCLLDSMYDQTQDSKKHDTWGPGVKWMAVFDGSGHMSIQIIAADRAKSASNSSRTPVGQAIGYFGTYSVDEAAKTVTYHIERCSFPNWNGTDRKLTLNLSGDELDLAAATSSTGTGFNQQVWKRAQ